MNPSPLHSRFQVVIQKLNKLLLFVILLVCSGEIPAQSDLESKRLLLTQEIKQLESELKKLQASKASKISKINALELQIEKQDQLVKTLKAEKKQEENNTDKNPLITSDLTEEYEKLLEQLEDLNKNESKINLSDKKQDTILIRSIIIKQIKNYLDQIEEVSNDLTTTPSISDLLSTEEERLQEMRDELDSLSDTVVSETKSQNKIESRLQNQIKRKEELSKKVEKLIVSNSSQNKFSSVSSAKTVYDQKGFLQYPLPNASIYLRYGEQKHPENKKLVIINTGIDLKSKDGNVHSVHEGKVINVAKVNNAEYTIIVSHHGDYYSVYSNIVDVHVSKNDYVYEGQSLGIPRYSNGLYSLHFELWKGKENLNPYHWLKNN